MIFLFFILVGCVLDIKQSKTKPIFLNVEADSPNPNPEVLDLDDGHKKNFADKTFDQSYVEDGDQQHEKKGGVSQTSNIFFILFSSRDSAQMMMKSYLKT